jgi:hypothetical protein
MKDLVCEGERRYRTGRDFSLDALMFLTPLLISVLLSQEPKGGVKGKKGGKGATKEDKAEKPKKKVANKKE